MLHKPLNMLNIKQNLSSISKGMDILEIREDFYKSPGRTLDLRLVGGFFSWPQAQLNNLHLRLINSLTLCSRPALR